MFLSLWKNGGFHNLAKRNWKKIQREQTFEVNELGSI